MYFHPEVAWPPATYDVISRDHSNWPLLKLSQNLCEGWTNSYAGSWCFIFYEKNEEKPYGGWDPPPPHVLARFKFKPKWTSMWKRIVSSKAIRINGVCLFTFSDRKDARLRFSLSTIAFDKHSSVSGFYRSRRSDISLLKNWLKVSARVKTHHFSKFSIFKWLSRAHQELSFKKNFRKKCFFCADLWSAKVFLC